MRRLIIAAVAAAVVLVGAQPAFAAPPGTAQTPTGTAVIAATLNTGIGTRVVSDAGSALTLVPTAGATTASANYSIAVAEVAVSGANPWTVTGQLFDNSNTPNQINQALAPTNVLAGAQFGVVNNVPSPSIAAPATTPHAGTAGDLSAALSLFSVNESPANVYTTTWTGTGTVTLTPPNGAATGAYTGTFVETLFQ